MASTAMIVCTHSYRMALPALRLPSMPVATCDNTHNRHTISGPSPEPHLPVREESKQGNCWRNRLL